MIERSLRWSHLMPSPLPSRRELLTAGGLTALGLSLPQLLHAQQSRTNKRREKHCIFIFQYGGLSQIDS